MVFFFFFLIKEKRKPWWVKKDGQFSLLRWQRPGGRSTKEGDMSGTACFVQITAQYAKEYDGRRKSYAIKRERERK